MHEGLGGPGGSPGAGAGLLRGAGVGPGGKEAGRGLGQEGRSQGAGRWERTSNMVPSACTWHTGKERPTMRLREKRRLICGRGMQPRGGRLTEQADVRDTPAPQAAVQGGAGLGI